MHLASFLRMGKSIWKESAFNRNRFYSKICYPSLDTESPVNREGHLRTRHTNQNPTQNETYSSLTLQDALCLKRNGEKYGMLEFLAVREVGKAIEREPLDALDPQ